MRLIRVIVAAVLIFGFASTGISADQKPGFVFEIVFTNTMWTDQFYSFLIDNSGFAYELKDRKAKPTVLGSVDPKELEYMLTLRVPAARGYFTTEKSDRLDMNVLSYYCYMEDPATGEQKRILLKTQAKEDTINSSKAAEELVKWISLQHYKLARKDDPNKQPPAKK